MPNLAAFLRQSGVLGALPGYGQDSLNEQLALDTPRATPSDEDSIRMSVKSDLQQQEPELSERRDSIENPESNEPVDLAVSPSTESPDDSSTSFMDPPLPLKIRAERFVPGECGQAQDHTGTTPTTNTALLPPVATPTIGTQPEQNFDSPGGASLASTTIPYDAPSAPSSPQHKVTFAPELQETQEQPYTPTGKQGMSSKFAAGLKLKGWSGKSNQKDQAATSPHSHSKEARSPDLGREPAKSPLPGLKGFKWWQKEGPQHAGDNMQSEFTGFGCS